MDCFLGATTGALKIVDLKESRFRNVNPIEKLVPKEHGIAGLCFGDNSESEVLALQKNGDVNLYSALHDTYTKLFNSEEGTPEMKAIQMSKESIVTANENGVIKVWSSKGECLAAEINAGLNLQFLTVDPMNPEVAVSGGRENDLKMWDLEAGKQLWSAKNVKHNYLSLRVPIWITNARYIKDSKYICTATGHHQIRLYEPNAQRRPVLEADWLSEPITALTTCHRPEHILAANTRGEMALFDLRGKIRPIQKYRGFAGSVRSMVAHPTEPYVASCGIDRFILIHHVEKRQILKKIYCKTRLNSVLMRNVNSLIKAPKDEPETIEDFFDDDDD